MFYASGGGDLQSRSYMISDGHAPRIYSSYAVEVKLLLIQLWRSVSGSVAVPVSINIPFSPLKSCPRLRGQWTFCGVQVPWQQICGRHQVSAQRGAQEMSAAKYHKLLNAVSKVDTHRVPPTSPAPGGPSVTSLAARLKRVFRAY